MPEVKAIEETPASIGNDTDVLSVLLYAVTQFALGIWNRGRGRQRLLLSFCDFRIRRSRSRPRGVEEGVIEKESLSVAEDART